MTAVHHFPRPALTEGDLVRLRRALAECGHAPVGLAAEGSGGRRDDAEIVPAAHVEDTALAWHPVPSSECWDGAVGFLDGTERVWVMAYAGVMPIVVAEVAAAVRERVDRRLATRAVERRAYVIARAAALDTLGPDFDGFERVVLDDRDAPHPVREQIRAQHRADQLRAALEAEVAARYRERADAWLLIDGTLSAHPALATDPRVAGIVKSHAALPFDGDELVRYLRLPHAHRSSLYRPALPPGRPPVHAFALRLWPWEDRDLFHGLIRVELAEATGTPAQADWLACRLLAERAPVSAPDPRWDRLLYGIHAVEEYLRA